MTEIKEQNQLSIQSPEGEFASSSVAPIENQVPTNSLEQSSLYETARQTLRQKRSEAAELFDQAAQWAKPSVVVEHVRHMLTSARAQETESTTQIEQTEALPTASDFQTYELERLVLGQSGFSFETQGPKKFDLSNYAAYTSHYKQPGFARDYSFEFANFATSESAHVFLMNDPEFAPLFLSSADASALSVLDLAFATNFGFVATEASEGHGDLSGSMASTEDGVVEQHVVFGSGAVVDFTNEIYATPPTAIHIEQHLPVVAVASGLGFEFFVSGTESQLFSDGIVSQAALAASIITHAQFNQDQSAQKSLGVSARHETFAKNFVTQKTERTIDEVPHSGSPVEMAHAVTKISEDFKPVADRMTATKEMMVPLPLNTNAAAILQGAYSALSFRSTLVTLSDRDAHQKHKHVAADLSHKMQVVSARSSHGDPSDHQSRDESTAQIFASEVVGDDEIADDHAKVSANLTRSSKDNSSVYIA